MDFVTSKVIKYYEILLSAAGPGGLIYAVGKKGCRIIKQGCPPPDLSNIEFELRDGIYCDFMYCVQGGHLVSTELKDLLSNYITVDRDNLQFIPVTVKSHEYEDRQYYFIHYSYLIDWIDYKNSITGDDIHHVIIPAVDYNKVKNLNMFPYPFGQYAMVVNNTIMREIKKRKMNKGISFGVRYCYNKT